MEIDSVRQREAAHFIPVVNRYPVALVEGHGSRVRDADGKEYLDLMAGWAVCNIGHCHPQLVEAIRDQAGRLMQTTNIFYTLPQIELIERIAGLSNGALPHSFLVNSGTEAIDGAVKLAHRATGRAKFVSTEKSFHGRSLGALRLIGQAKHRHPYAALLPEGCVVPFDDLDAARAAVDDQTAAFVIEPVQGEGGVNVPAGDYLAGLSEICRAKGALLICDEVQTGVGRTGTLLGYQHEDVTPDIITLGKGLGGGFPVAAFACTPDVAKTVSISDHGTTFGGNPLASAAANAVLRVVIEEKLSERATELGAKLQERLRAFGDEHPGTVSDVRGRGLLVGMELTDADLAGGLASRALEAGVLVNVTAGTVVRFFPALTIPKHELWEGVDKVLGLIS